MRAQRFGRRGGLNCGLDHVGLDREAVFEDGSQHARVRIEPQNEQGPPPHVAGQVHFLGDRHLLESSQEILIRRPPDHGMHAGVGRQVRQITPEERRDERERVGARSSRMRGQGLPDGVVLPRGAVAEDLLESFGGEVGPAQELQALRFGSHALALFLRRQAPARLRARDSTAATRPWPSRSAAATSAEPTTTPSASRAARRAPSGVEMPNPIAIGSSPAASRARATVAERSRGRSRARARGSRTGDDVEKAARQPRGFAHPSRRETSATRERPCRVGLAGRLRRTAAPPPAGHPSGERRRTRTPPRAGRRRRCPSCAPG